MTLTDNPVTLYIQTSIAELRKVTWPTRRETAMHALLVVGITLGVAAVFTGVDALLSKGLEALLTLVRR